MPLNAKTVSTVQAQRVIPISPALMFDYFVSQPCLRYWLCDFALLEARPKGRVLLSWHNGKEICGRMQEFLPAQRLLLQAASYSLQIDFVDTVDGTQVVISTDENCALRQSDWEFALENLAHVIETGQDLRQALRPVLGVYGEPELIRLNGQRTASEFGLGLKSVVPDSPALRAGLQVGDNLVQIADTYLQSMSDLTTFMQNQTPEDVVSIIYVRQGEYHETTAMLQARPIPPIPANKEELFNKIKHQDDDAMWLYAEAVDGISEMEARYRPAENEWSVSEVLAHLILWQRHSCDSAVLIARGEEPGDSFWVANDPLRIQSVLDGVRSLDGLLQALRNAHRAKESLILNVGSEILLRPERWAGFCNALSDDWNHNSEHLDQIRACIRAAQRDL